MSTVPLIRPADKPRVARPQLSTRHSALSTREWLPLAAITLLAAGLRWYRIDAQSLWYDEGISAHQLSRSLGEILRASALDTHPPLYYWTIKLWGQTVGTSELDLRSLSAVWGTLAVVLTYAIGRRLFGRLAATVAALLLGLAPLAIYYSQEVRMYAQVTALGLLAAYAYCRRSWWLYVVAGVATLYTQYLGIATLAAINLHWLAGARRHPRRQWLRWVLANAAIGLAFVPWLPTFLDQQTHALNTSPRTALGLVRDSLMAYGGGIAQGETPLVGGLLLVLMAAFGVMLAVRRLPGGVGLVLLLWLLPLGLVLGLGLRSGLFEVRYLVVGLPGLLLLAGLGVARITREPASAIALALALAVPTSIALQQQYFDPALARDDYRGLVQAIQAAARPTDAILLSAPNQIEVFGYYYHGPLPVIGLPAQRPIDPADTVQRLVALEHQYQRVWLVRWAMNEADPQGVILTWLASNGFQTSHAWFGTLQLASISFAAPEASSHALGLPLDNGIALDSYRLSAESVQPGETLALTLVWRAEAVPTERWKVFTHLLDGNSKVVAQWDAEPADNLRPTTTWAAGEVVEDHYGIAVPADLAPGSYVLEVGMYAGERRAVFQGQGNHLILGTITVQS